MSLLPCSSCVSFADFGPAEARKKKPAPARAGKRGDMDDEIPF
jgi:hypothetical protein